jgi:hypothetical protein
MHLTAERIESFFSKAQIRAHGRQVGGKPVQVRAHMRRGEAQPKGERPKREPTVWDRLNRNFKIADQHTRYIAGQFKVDAEGKVSLVDPEGLVGLRLRAAQVGDLADAAAKDAAKLKGTPQGAKAAELAQKMKRYASNVQKMTRRKPKPAPAEPKPSLMARVKETLGATGKKLKVRMGERKYPEQR